MSRNGLLGSVWGASDHYYTHVWGQGGSFAQSGAVLIAHGSECLRNFGWPLDLGTHPFSGSPVGPVFVYCGHILSCAPSKLAFKLMQSVPEGPDEYLTDYRPNKVYEP